MRHTKDYNDVDWGSIVFYDESSPTFLRYISGNNTPSPKNKRLANEVAGTLNKKYASIKYNNKSWLIHRIVWILHKGSIEVQNVINHIDFNTHNNCIENLEECTFRQNLCRTKILKNINLNHRNISSINGIHECVKNNGYKEYKYASVQWMDEYGKARNKLFSYEKYSKEIAWKLAVEFRMKIDADLADKGFR